MGEVVPARTSPTLHPPFPPTVHQLSRLALQELNQLWKLIPITEYNFRDICLPVLAHPN